MGIIETVCAYPQQVVMGGAALIGALISAGMSIYQKKKADKKFKFEGERIADTIWQSVTAGAVAGATIGCGTGGMLVAAITGIGVDKLANKFKVSETQILNVAQWLTKLFVKK